MRKPMNRSCVPSGVMNLPRRLAWKKTSGTSVCLSLKVTERVRIKSPPMIYLFVEVMLPMALVAAS
jgi:hypothetical protein